MSEEFRVKWVIWELRPRAIVVWAECRSTFMVVQGGSVSKRRLHKNAAFFPINYKEIRRKIAFAFLKI